MWTRAKKTFKILGPGMLFAGAAIGVSHLVQSTRAGAEYGFALVLIVILANLFKYPFFEFGPRYTAATGNSLLDGYKKVGQWALILFTVFTVLTMFIITATVTIVTSGLVMQILGLESGIMALNILILGICGVVLIHGRFGFIQRIMKIVIVFLSVVTVASLLFAIFGEKALDPNFVAPVVWSAGGIAFVLALMGWMPAPIEISVWQSVWAVERNELQKSRTSASHSSIDFNVGYIGTAIMALLFLSLGALIMYGTGEVFAESAAEFAGQLILLYTNALGSWAWFLIALAALMTMFSTTLTVLDAYPRVLQKVLQIYSPKTKKVANVHYRNILLVVVLGTLCVLALFGSNMKALVMFTTIMSFMTGPIFAFMNYKTITDKHVPADARPPKWLLVLSWLGLAFLVGFTIVYFVWQLM